MVIGFTSASAQIEKFEALFMYNFAQNTNWDNIGDQELIITVVSNKEVASILGSMAQTKKVGSRQVVVKEVEDVNQATASQIIYVGSSKVKQLPTLSSVVKTDDILVISGKSGQCKSGADISFKVEEGKLRYEINIKTIETKHLSITSKLINLGIKVN